METLRQGGMARAWFTPRRAQHPQRRRQRRRRTSSSAGADGYVGRDGVPPRKTTRATKPRSECASAPLPISIDDVHAAAARIEGVAHRTPPLRSRTLDAWWGAPPGAQGREPPGAFKFRGALNAVAALRPDGVCSVSSGNHAQSLALAAREQGRATILMPSDAPASNGAATQGLQRRGHRVRPLRRRPRRAGARPRRRARAHARAPQPRGRRCPGRPSPAARRRGGSA